MIKFKLFSFLLIVLLVTISTSGCSQQQNTIDNKTPELQEKTKENENYPTLKYEKSEIIFNQPSSLTTLKKSPNALLYKNRKFYIIIQLNEDLSKQAREQLKQYDIELENSLHNSSYYVSIPESSLNSVGKLNLIKGWAEKPIWAKTDSTYRSIISGDVPSLQSKPIKVKISFYRDFPARYQEDVFTKANIPASSTRRISSSKFEVTETLDNLNKLIMYNSVSYLSADNTPPITN